MSIDDVVEVAPRPPARGRRRTLAIVAVVAVLGAGGGVAAWAATRPAGTGNPGGPVAGPPVGCPDTVANPRSATFDLATQVPALPSGPGVDGRLVPTRTPVDLVLCSYPAAGVASDTSASSDEPAPASAPATFPLGPQVTLPPSDRGAATLLALLQSATPYAANQEYACPDIMAPTTQYLVGLRYTDGLVWVATPGGCAGSTNGATTTGTDAAAAVADALEAATSGVGSAVPPASGSGAPGDPGSSAPDPDPSATPPADPFASCVTPAPTKPTAVDRLVPFTPTAVRICHLPVGPNAPATTVERPAAAAVALADAVNASPPRPPDTACPDIGGETWRLLFTAAGGQQASVLVDSGGCRTVSVYGRALQASDALFTLLDAND